ncbi:SMR family transporter [Mitsuaria sp. GD03876]|uniref:SMR family transporter n=1 Tax=Mitsuaria sp. GD03876 TaxID=2975399 RepID=UPI00244D1669|nr:SMR family transporter [Mitsuaria sp. GD03876]MDH0864524.1 SMR family transporter [Mitsuaria sp. GD03876]
MSKPYLYLAIAIVCEVFATTCLKYSEGFTRLVPGALTVLGYGAAFYCLSQTLGSIPTGIAYAIWSGVGIVLISVLGLFLFDQKLDLPALVGIGLILAGVLVINLLSKSSAH